MTEDRLEQIADTLADHGWEVTVEGDALIHVIGGFSNPERVAVGGVGVAPGESYAVWAANPTGGWALVGWRRPDIVVVTYNGTQVRWRHRRLPSHLPPDGADFLSGQPSPYDLVTKPKHQPTDAARAVLAGLDVPEEWFAGLLADADRSQRAAREAEAAAKAAAAPTVKPKATPRVRVSTAAAPKPAERPAPAVCSRCFMQLPATGICGNCD